MLFFVITPNWEISKIFAKAGNSVDFFSKKCFTIHSILVE